MLFSIYHNSTKHTSINIAQESKMLVREYYRGYLIEDLGYRNCPVTRRIIYDLVANFKDETYYKLMMDKYMYYPQIFGSGFDLSATVDEMYYKIDKCFKKSNIKLEGAELHKYNIDKYQASREQYMHEVYGSMYKPKTML